MQTFGTYMVSMSTTCACVHVGRSPCNLVLRGRTRRRNTETFLETLPGKKREKSKSRTPLFYTKESLCVSEKLALRLVNNCLYCPVVSTHCVGGTNSANEIRVDSSLYVLRCMDRAHACNHLQAFPVAII